MTEAENIITRALGPMRDQDQQFFAPDIMLGFLNEGQNDLAMRELLFIGSANGTITSGVFTIADTLYLRLRDIPGVAWIDETVWDQYDQGDYSDTNRPYAKVIGKTVSILPVPADTTVYPYTYYKLPTQLTGSGSELEVDVVHENKLLQFLRYKASEMAGDLQTSQTQLALYETGLHSVDRAFRGPRKGPWTMPRELSRMDTDVDAIHL